MVTIRGIIKYKKKETKAKSSHNKAEMASWRDNAVAAGKCPTCKKPKDSKECREWHKAYWKVYNEKRKAKRAQAAINYLLKEKYT